MLHDIGFIQQLSFPSASQLNPCTHDCHRSCISVIKSYSVNRTSSFSFATRSPPSTPVFIILDPVAIAMCEMCESVDSPDLCDVIILMLFFLHSSANFIASYRLPAWFTFS